MACAGRVEDVRALMPSALVGCTTEPRAYSSSSPTTPSRRSVQTVRDSGQYVGLLVALASSQPYSDL